MTMTPKEITKKTVCIVRFKNPLTQNDVRPGIFFQVTIDPGALSPSGRFIRFGPNPGDEIIGWQRVDFLAIEEILGEWTDDKPPTLEYKPATGVTMAIEDLVRPDKGQFEK